MKKVIYNMALAVLPLALTGCPSSYEWECSLPTTRSERQSQQTQPISPIVQIDGTPSMQGFVNIPDSRYIRTLRLLDAATTTAFVSSDPPQYYKFGTIRVPLIGEKSTRIAQRPEYYVGNSEFLLNARIDKAIEPLDNNTVDKLYIIVTDLYQQNAEMTQLFTSLKANYLDKGLAIGLLGVRSEFSGTVYDVGLKNSHFEYKTTPDQIETFHPFYVMVLGNYENVANYFDRLKEVSEVEGLNFGKDQFVIFYNQLVTQPSLLQVESDTLDINLQGIERQVTINDGQVMIQVKNEQTVERLGIRDSSQKWQKIPYKIAYNPLPYVLSLASNFRIELSGEFNNSSSDMQEIEASNIENFLKIEDWKIEQDMIEFSLSLNSDNMKRGIYGITIDVLPADIEGRDWWKDWNLAETNEFDGAKTYNLLPFLENLKKSNFKIMSQSREAAIARFCYVFHKK